MPNVQVVGLCDVDEAHIGAKAKALESRGKPRATAYTDVRQMLENKDIDAISIATPNHWHALSRSGPARRANDVYVEKPARHNVWKAADRRGARKYNRIVQQRHAEPLRRRRSRRR